MRQRCIPGVGRENVIRQPDLVTSHLVDALDGDVPSLFVKARPPHEPPWVRAAYRASQDAMADLVEKLTAFVEAREYLAETEQTLTPLMARARKLGIEVPPYDSLAYRATHDTALNALQQRARVAVRDGFFGSR